jgi:hypothetical protein
MALAALVSIRITSLLDREAGEPSQDSGRFDLMLLAASALLSVVLSLVGFGAHSLWAYALNALKPLFPKSWHRI